MEFSDEEASFFALTARFDSQRKMWDCKYVAKFGCIIGLLYIHPLAYLFFGIIWLALVNAQSCKILVSHNVVSWVLQYLYSCFRVMMTDYA